MNQASVIGVDIGGTKTFVARYALPSFTLEAEERIVTDAARGLPAVLQDVCAMVKKLQTPGTRAIGVGVAGPVETREGILLKAPNIPQSDNVPLRSMLQEKLGLPISVDNDANCFTLAEALVGAAKGQRVVVGITLGTGVGGGIAIDGQIFSGAHGYAAEIGHMLLMPGQPPAGTTNPRGEVEQFLSGTALGQRCQQAEDPAQYLQGATCEFLHPDVFRETAWLCTNLAHLLDPSVIVFGGSTGAALKPHLPAIQQELKQWMLPGSPVPALAISTVHHAGVAGAALLCLSGEERKALAK